MKETDQRSVLNELPLLMSHRLSRLLNKRQRLHMVTKHTVKLKVEQNYMSFVLAGICVICGDQVLCRQRSLCSSPARILWLTGETLIYNRRGGKKKKKRTERRATISRKLTLQRGHQRDNRHCWMVITPSHYAAAVV